jgi:hypothetical protein
LSNTAILPGGNPVSLLNRLKVEVLDVLGPKGWGTLFSRHGLDISVPLDELEEELARPLRIDRIMPGFEDFSLGGYRAIEPARPGYSLLYHALASANVTPDDGDQSVFPTLIQLDLVENYIYSQAKPTIASFEDPVIAVFAYQYRDRAKTTHRRHADLVFSRTGLARVGTHPPRYEGTARGYDPRPNEGEIGFRVLPARYAVFIAERRPQPPDGSVLRGVSLDGGLSFLFPVHKLFSGNECMFTDADGGLKPIELAEIVYAERHVNEKLARIHSPQDGENPGYVPPMENPKFDLKEAPFFRDSATDHGLVKLINIGASCQVEPIAAPLVSTAAQRVAGKDELVRFIVPPPKEINGRPNRYWSSLELTANGLSRAAPEYLNIRQEVAWSVGSHQIVDMNTLAADEFTRKVIAEGGYEAAHFVDNTCDGALAIEPIQGIDLPILCAYSLVTAIDYFPYVDQVEVEEWLEKKQHRSTGISDAALVFPQGSPQPMSDGRFQWDTDSTEVGLSITYQLPNCTLPDPVRSNEKAFSLVDPTNYTATAVVGSSTSSDSLQEIRFPKRPPGWLPDSASDVFAPGWDVSQHLWKNQNMLVAYGLGSPFPEDAKLCAALNSFWPAVSPDSSRTYGYRPPRLDRPARLLHTSIPLLDSELGYHAQHPRALAKEVSSKPGWDGDFGPFIGCTAEERYVDASNPLRADQTRAAYDKQVHFSGLDQVTTESLLIRMEALIWCRREFDEWCRREFNKEFDHPKSAWWLVSFEHVPDWSAWQSKTLPSASPDLVGDGLIFVFASVGKGADFGVPPLRRRFVVQHSFEIQVANLDPFSPSGESSSEPIAFYRKNLEPFILKTA